MPTKGEIHRPNHLALHFSSQESTRSWTDDLPVCHLSGVGFSTNQVYRRDGTPSEQHEFEDKSFHFRVDDTYFYGLFDGHCGKKAAHFAAQRMPAEILLGQLDNRGSAQSIKEILCQAFCAVEKGFFESIDDLLAQKADLECQLQENQMCQNSPEIVDCLHAVSSEISGGTTAVVALIVKKQLYVANVGNSRAVLCKRDEENGLQVIQLSVDHDIDNEDELLRLSELGLDVKQICEKRKLGNQVNTRCIGNYMVKGGYKECDDIIRNATEEPVIAEPEIFGGITIDKSCKFLLLMSDGLYKSLEEATGTKQVNQDIVVMVIEQFACQTTLTGVAQAVVDKVVRIHHDTYMRGTMGAVPTCHKRGDITLLVRNFNEPLPCCHQSPLSASQMLSNTCSSNFDQYSPIITKRMSGIILTGRPDPESLHSSPITTEQHSGSETVTSYTESGDGKMLFQSTRCRSLPLNENGRINPYVDFSKLYIAYNETDNQEERN